MRAIFYQRSIVVCRLFCEQLDLFLIEQLDLLAGCLHLLKRVLAAEEFRDESFKAVFYFLLLCLGDIAAHLGPRDQQNKGHFQHLLVAEQESHLWKAFRVA